LHVVAGRRLQGDAGRRRAAGVLRRHRHTDCLLIAGSNTAWAHPVLFRRIEETKARNPALKIIVVDPRRTATAGLGRHVHPDPAGHRRRALQRDAAPC
jgi:anaerobic selenocysteine-containing dehydrogenase